MGTDREMDAERVEQTGCEGAGQEVASAEQFREVLLQLTPKETYSVTVMREGTKGYKKITCKLKAGVLQ